MELTQDNSITHVVQELIDRTHRPVSADSECVLELLALTMFADKQVLASEIQTFVAIVLRFQDENILTSQMSETEVIHWYEIHKGDLSKVVQHGIFETWIEERIHKLRDFPDKHLLLRGIDEIALADGEKHVSEKALEVLTAKKWADALLKLYSQNKPILIES